MGQFSTVLGTHTVCKPVPSAASNRHPAGWRVPWNDLQTRGEGPLVGLGEKAAASNSGIRRQAEFGELAARLEGGWYPMRLR